MRLARTAFSELWGELSPALDLRQVECRLLHLKNCSFTSELFFENERRRIGFRTRSSYVEASRMDLAMSAIIVGVLIAVIRTWMDIRTPDRIEINEEWLGISPSEFFEKHSKD